MERVSMGRFNCDEVRIIAGAYVDGELLPEEDAEVLRHVGLCCECAGVIGSSKRLKGILRTGVKRSLRRPPCSGTSSL
jgi:anti-sigma factor RsiW